MDTYKTFEIATDAILLKEKNSKFYGYGFPIISDLEVKPILENLRKQHLGAGHFCYAYQIGIEKTQFRVNDDGEPSNTAGLPIYGQIKSFVVTNILIVVIRYFGGTKLGVGGLISAYKTAALLVLEAAIIVERTVNIHYLISFEYKNLNNVMRIIKEKKLQIINQNMNLSCEIEVVIPQKKSDIIVGIFKNLYKVEIVIKI